MDFIGGLFCGLVPIHGVGSVVPIQHLSGYRVVNSWDGFAFAL